MSVAPFLPCRAASCRSSRAPRPTIWPTRWPGRRQTSAGSTPCCSRWGTLPLSTRHVRDVLSADTGPDQPRKGSARQHFGMAAVCGGPVTVAPLVLFCADTNRVKALMEQVRISGVLCCCTWSAACTNRGGALAMARHAAGGVSNEFGCPGSNATPQGRPGEQVPVLACWRLFCYEDDELLR